ncbi:superoxide dismutase 2, mitochondrial [Lanmaoa asiatica]|nr:superoxide dismutase 2, mitochondrial [Lanmaoa asiatica]
MAHSLPPLPYDYNAVEPYILEHIVTLHHTRHHQAYVTALNAAESNYVKAATPKERIALQTAIHFNGGAKSPICARPPVARDTYIFVIIYVIVITTTIDRTVLTSLSFLDS